MHNLTFFSNLERFNISLLNQGVGGTHSLSKKTKQAYNYKLENYKHTSMKGGII